MADNKKYYYLKLKEGFFDSEEMKLLQSMKDGYLYSDILLKLYLLSLRQEGRLMYRDIIPYSSEMISTLTNHQVGTVERAMKALQQLGLVEILDNGAIYMKDIQNFIGQSSTEADRKRLYRAAIDAEKSRISSSNNETNVGQIEDKCPDNVHQTSDISTPENRDKRLEIRDKETRDKSTEVLTVPNGTVRHTEAVRRVVEAWNSLTDIGIKPVSRLTAGTKRHTSLIARLNEYGEDDVIKAISNIRNSDFLQGKTGRKGWVITFDWFVLPNNFPKVLEGNYDNDKAQESEFSTMNKWKEAANAVRRNSSNLGHD